MTAVCSCTQSARVCGWHGHYDRALVPVNHVCCVNHRMRDVLHPVLGKGAFDKPRTGISKDKSTISQMHRMGLARQGAALRCEDVEIAKEEGMMEIVPQLEMRKPYVAPLSNIATLLRGTIMGLVKAFTPVSNIDLAEKANLVRQYFGRHE